MQKVWVFNGMGHLRQSHIVCRTICRGMKDIESAAHIVTTNAQDQVICRTMKESTLVKSHSAVLSV